MRISDWSSDVCSSDLTVCEGAGHARDLGRAGADGLGGIAPRSGDNRDFFDDGAYLRQRECKKSRCNLQEVDVRRQHPRLEIGRDWIEVIGGRERPTCLATAEEAMVAKMIVDIGNAQDEGDAPIDRSEEHTSELQSLMRISYAVFCLTKN